MKNRKTALIGLILPALPLGAYTLLALLSFVNYTVNSVIAVDKLLLLTVAMSPLIYISGAVASIIALFKSEMKVFSFVGVVLNLAFLVILLCFSNLIFIEFKLVT